LAIRPHLIHPCRYRTLKIRLFGLGTLLAFLIPRPDQLVNPRVRRRQLRLWLLANLRCKSIQIYTVLLGDVREQLHFWWGVPMRNWAAVRSRSPIARSGGTAFGSISMR